MIWLALKILFCTLVLIKVILYFTNARCKSNVCLVGKTALITGGNAGLGLELAKQLASRGCVIIIADKDDATNTVKKLIEETKNPHISAKIVDFASFKSVRLFANELKQNVKKLDILVNNAGTADMSLKKTEDGIQKIMQVNYFSHFLLTHLLLELLLISVPSRIIYTSSLAAYIAYLTENELTGKLPSNWFIRTAGSYSSSKLAGAIMSRILARKLKNTGVTANVYHPGVVRTNLWYTGMLPQQINSLVWLLWPCIFGKFDLTHKKALVQESREMKNLKEKVALITGSREGIGFQTAIQLASRNWKIIMADNQDLKNAKEKIISRTKNEKIYINHLDLASFKSVRKFAEEIKRKHDRLDVVVNNAGIFESQLEKTEDNLCYVMQVNHLGPFLLTTLLKDLLKQSSPSRIIFLTSSGAFLHTLNNDELPLSETGNNGYSILKPTLTYYNSKLCNMIISKEFARRLKPYRVTANCLHPGMTNSNFLIKNNYFIKFMGPVVNKIIQLSTQDVEISAQMTTFLATSNSLVDITGQYFVNYQASGMPKIVYNCDYCKRIWDDSKKLVKLMDNETI